jgi:hypothetical protein
MYLRSLRRALLALLALPLLVLAAADAAAAYNPAVVAADARWIVHTDFDRLRATELGKELVAAIEKSQAEATGGAIGLDIPRVLKTVGALTAYGTNLEKDPAAIDGVLVAQGTAELRKIAESVLLQGTLAEPKVFAEAAGYPFPVYAISDAKAAPGAKPQVLVAFPPEPVVLVSKSKERLLQAHAVIRGAAPSLAKAADSALGRLAAKTGNAYLFAATVVPTDAFFGPNAPQTRMLQLAGSGSLALGERGSDTFARAELVASSAANAEKLMKILQGMTAMLSLAETTDKQLAEFLNSTAVSRTGDTVVLDLAYSSARLATMVKSLQATAESKPAVRPAAPLVAGRALAEWNSADVPAEAAVDGLHWRTIENVALYNGATITLGRSSLGSRNARFDRLEVIPAAGQGSPLVFRQNALRTVRNTMSQVQFPGVDGTYTLRVAYADDPERKTQFAVSVSKQPPAPAAPATR